MTLREAAWSIVSMILAPFGALALLAAWPAQESIRAAVACDIARASGRPLTLASGNGPRTYAWEGPLEEGPTRPLPKETECHRHDSGETCRVGGMHGEPQYSVYNSRDWFGGGPDNPGRTGIGVSRDEAYWWRAAGGLFGSGVPSPTAIVFSPSVLCVSFEDAQYALDAATLRELSVAVPPEDRLWRRLTSGLGVAFALIAFLGGLAVAWGRRYAALSRAFGPGGERAVEGVAREADGVAVGGERVLSRGAVARFGPLRDLVAGEPVLFVARGPGREAGAPYRHAERTVEALSVFAGDHADLWTTLAAQARVRTELHVATLLGQTLVLAGVALVLWVQS